MTFRVPRTARLLPVLSRRAEAPAPADLDDEVAVPGGAIASSCSA